MSDLILFLNILLLCDLLERNADTSSRFDDIFSFLELRDAFQVLRKLSRNFSKHPLSLF